MQIFQLLKHIFLLLFRATSLHKDELITFFRQFKFNFSQLKIVELLFFSAIFFRCFFSDQPLSDQQQYLQNKIDPGF